jgi:hypothetical protein
MTTLQHALMLAIVVCSLGCRQEPPPRPAPASAVAPATDSGTSAPVADVGAEVSTEAPLVGERIVIPADFRVDGIDERAVYATGILQKKPCDKKWGCHDSRELRHDAHEWGAVTIQNGDWSVPYFNSFGPTKLVIHDGTTAPREIVLWPEYNPPSTVIRDGASYYVEKVISDVNKKKEFESRTEVYVATVGKKPTLIFAAKGSIEKLTLNDDSLEYDFEGTSRRRPKTGGKEVVVGPVDGGFRCDKRGLVRSVGDTPEAIDTDCAEMHYDRFGLVWTSWEKGEKPGTFTGRVFLRVMPPNGKPQSLGAVNGGALKVSSKWIYVVGKEDLRRVAR